MRTSGQFRMNFIGNSKYNVDFKAVLLGDDHYFVPSYAEHRPAVIQILEEKLYEPETHRFVEFLFRKSSGSMIHAGAFFGDMLPNFSRIVDGTIYAFEPVLENYILAKLTIDENNLRNIILFNSALGSKIENLHINTVQSETTHAGGSSKIDNDGRICTVTTIDSLGLNNLVLVELDVEGYELSALEGAQASIQRCKPVIAIEDNNANCDFFLTKCNYRQVGQIPGLKVWCTKTASKLTDLACNFFNQTAR